MKIGVFGTGLMAQMMADTLNRMPEVTCYGVASRKQETAEAFAKQYGFEKAYGSYEELACDVEVELIYIATPHALHYEHAVLCMENNKPVLCEKAFTRNAKEARALVALAKEKGLLLAEAIWTRYMPSRTLLAEVLAEEIIGKPVMLTANLGYVIAGIERIIRPELAGGALLDVGVYPLNFALMAFGKDITAIQTSALIGPTGVDLQNSTTLIYGDGRMAVLNSTALGRSDRKGIIYGEKGYIIVENINNCEGIQIYDKEGSFVKEITIPAQISGYEYQVRAVIDAIKKGAIACEQMPHEETIHVMEIMDYLRKQWGVVYPGEA